MLDELICRYQKLSECRNEIEAAKDCIIECYENGGKLLLCGNGGSAADCEHIAGELMKGFMKRRPISDGKKAEMKANCPEITDNTLARLQCGLPAIPLTSFTGLNTAFSNDVDPNLVFAQSVFAAGKKGDVVVCISTSGNSKNVVSAAAVAKSLGIRVIALTGESGGKLASLADICIKAPATETYKVQEYHLPIYHCLCAATEAHFFAE